MCIRDSESIITNQRYAYINKVVERCVVKKAAKHSLTTSDKIDQVVTNRVLALPIFAVIMWAVYWIAMGPFGSFLTDWTNDVLGSAWLVEGSRSILEGLGCADWLTSLVADGIFAGVGAVLGFVPQMLVLFFMLSILCLLYTSWLWRPRRCMPGECPTRCCPMCRKSWWAAARWRCQW